MNKEELKRKRREKDFRYWYYPRYNNNTGWEIQFSLIHKGVGFQPASMGTSKPVHTYPHRQSTALTLMTQADESNEGSLFRPYTYVALEVDASASHPSEMKPIMVI